MSEKQKDQAIIIKQEEIAYGIYSMWLKTAVAKTAKPGQFISMYCHDKTKLLPRPISICEIDAEDESLRVVYRIAGDGTKEFSQYHTGMEIDIVGPLGNGFPIEHRKSIIIGGGIGIPPMLQLSKELTGAKQIVLGYRDIPFLKEQFDDLGQVFVATEDGCMGTKGTVIDAIRENGLEADVIYACGPKPMLKAVKAYAEELGVTCYISLEERMACGVGACLGCVCQSKDVDEHSHVHNKRVCKDGPVFLAQEVEL